MSHQDIPSDVSRTATQIVDAQKQAIIRRGGTMVSERRLTMEQYEGVELSVSLQREREMIHQGESQT